VYAWLLLGERLTPLQLLGAVVVLFAIAFARGARRAPGEAGAQSYAQRASIQSSTPRHSESP